MKTSKNFENCAQKSAKIREIIMNMCETSFKKENTLNFANPFELLEAFGNFPNTSANIPMGFPATMDNKTKNKSL